MTFPRLPSVAAGLVLALATTLPVRADDKPDKSGYTLLNPTPDSAMRDFSTDRPAKSNSAITVDAGHFLIESDLANFTYDRFAGTTTRTIQTLDPVLKLGVTNWADIELQLNGYQGTVAGDGMGGVIRAHGFADVLLRTKINIIGNDGGDLAIAAIPYVKLPSRTAMISNGVVEGGVLVPIQYKLPSDFLLTFMPEFDLLKNAATTARHANFVNIVNVVHPVPGIKDLTAAVEFYSSVSAERLSPDIYTADFALSYMVNPRLQLDAGVNIGLNRAAPNLQAYTGIAYRF
jgi:hypothetical protein